MQKFTWAPFLAIIFTFPLWGDVDYDDSAPKSEGHPFTLHLQYDSIGKASFDDKCYKDQGVSYEAAMGYAGLVFCYNKAMDRGAYALVGYTQTNIGWKDNPYFDQDEFKELNLGIGLFTKQLCDWVWQFRAIGNFDTEHGPVGRYSTYDLLLWGRYNYTACIGLHFGACVYTGMRIDWVYPVLGFDYYINEKWKLNAIFPLDISLNYKITSHLTAAIATHFYRSRHRIGKNDPIPQGLVQYQNNGAEFKLNYEWNDSWNVSLYAGEAFGGHFKVANQKNHDPHRLDIGASGFFGGEFNFSY